MTSEPGDPPPPLPPPPELSITCVIGRVSARRVHKQNAINTGGAAPEAQCGTGRDGTRDGTGRDGRSQTRDGTRAQYGTRDRTGRSARSQTRDGTRGGWQEGVRVRDSFGTDKPTWQSYRPPAVGFVHRAVTDSAGIDKRKYAYDIQIDSALYDMGINGELNGTNKMRYFQGARQVGAICTQLFFIGGHMYLLRIRQNKWSTIKVDHYDYNPAKTGIGAQK